MAITYSSDIGLHGNITTRVGPADLQFEPSLTLCSPDVFDAWAGPVSHDVLSQVALTTGFQRIAARALVDPTVSVRISVYSVWLEPGEFPSIRPDWHIDRIGGLRKKLGIEYVDLTDNLRFASFLLTSIFLPDRDEPESIDSRSTEFLLARFEGESGVLWADMREMHNDIDSWLARAGLPRVLKAGDRAIVTFSPRTVHRAGRASVAGWSYLFRLGLYTSLEPCSPYADHMVFYNPAWHEPTGQVRFRKCGSTVHGPEPSVRSVPLISERGARDAAVFVASNRLRVGTSASRLSSILADAAVLGRQQVGLA